MPTTTLRRAQIQDQPQRWTELTGKINPEKPGTTEDATQIICKGYFPEEELRDWRITAQNLRSNWFPEEELRDWRITGEDLRSNWAEAHGITNASRRAWAQLPEAIEEDLKRISSLPAGWDGRSRSAVPALTMERTRYFLRLAYSWSGSGLPEPFIGPGPDGRVVLEWETENGKELIVDVPKAPEAPIRFLLVEPTETGEELQIESEFSDKWSTQAIVTRLMAKPPTANS
jgi:hypothetical protein